MSDHDRTHQALDLLAEPGAYDVLHAMHARDGAATFAQIAAATARPLALLRALAVAGLVIAPRCGTLDLEPEADTHFCLTARGEVITGYLVRIQQWAATRSAARDTDRYAC